MATTLRGFMLLGYCCLILSAVTSVQTQTQTKRASRITSSRSFGTNIKSSASNGINFDCPEEFGYYPHPTDCTQYYVCVFGGALLESCTGGLMYSHELQTCDWPRNVGCEVVDSGSAASSDAGLRETSGSGGRSKQQQQSIANQHVPSRIRFGSAFTSPAAAAVSATTQPSKPTVPPQYHRQPPQVIQAQVQTIPPPPELKVPPNPIITSRGHPKALLDSQEEIAKLYADAQETLPPVEEEESDRQQRVYRGQPSTVSQVQRDRDGIIHQASINAIPNHGKIGSYAFGSQYSKYFVDPELSHNRLDVEDIDVDLSDVDEEYLEPNAHRRVRRDVTATEPSTAKVTANEQPTTEVTALAVSLTETASAAAGSGNNATLTAKAVEDSSTDNTYSNQTLTTTFPTPAGVGHPSVEPRVDLQSESELPTAAESTADPTQSIELDYVDSNDTDGDSVFAESVRAPRQLRHYTNARSRWPIQSIPGTHYRSIDSNLHQQQPSYSFGAYNPYLTPPANQFNHLNQLSPGYQVYPQRPQQAYSQKPEPTYTRHHLSPPPPPVEDDFRPMMSNYYHSGTTTTTTTTPRPPNLLSQPDLLPYILQSLKLYKEQRKKLQQDNYSYYHLENKPVGESVGVAHTTSTPLLPQYHQTPKTSSKSTPNSHYAQFSTVGGFYNNQPTTSHRQPSSSDSKTTMTYPSKLVSQYSIVDSNYVPTSSTESNYFKYNIVANQKMKGVYDNALKTSGAHRYTTPSPPTSNINIVAAPNLAFSRPTTVKQSPFIEYSKQPLGSGPQANATKLPESYQSFTSVLMSSTIAPKLKASTATQQTTPRLKLNLQFNIPEFVASLQATDLANVNPTVLNVIKYFKQVNAAPAIKPERRPISAAAGVLGDGQLEQQIESSSERGRPQTKRPMSAASYATVPQSPSPTKHPLKHYGHSINSIPSAGHSPKQQNAHRPLGGAVTDDYYDEYETEEYEPPGSDSDDAILPPSQMPPYMPMSETMAPPRPQMLPPATPTLNPPHHKLNYQTGYIEATTTRRPFVGAQFQQFYQSATEASTISNSNNHNNNQIPAFIKFPTDIFQEIKQRQTTTAPATTVRTTRPSTASTRTTTPTTTTRLTTTTTMTTTTMTTTTARPRYTVRPQRTRGHNKWPYTKNKVQLPAKTDERGNGSRNHNTADFGAPNFRRRPTATPATSALGALQLSVNMNLDVDHGHRVDSSSPSSQAPTPANLFVQPPRPNNVIVETIPSNHNPNQNPPNRNYYNTSALLNHAGYESQANIQQHQQQQQPNPHIQHQHQQQQQQQQPQQAPSPPEQSSYETYYSVYDDDLDLYRDIEYQQQHQHQQQQHRQQSQQQQQPQYQQPIRNAQPQTTYRPLEILTTPAPQRDVYNNNKPLQQEKPNYNNQQTLIYNTDYDDDLLAQIEQDNVYDQPTRSPTRRDHITIRTLNERASSTVRPPTAAHDARDYYRTLTTPSAPVDTTDQSFDEPIIYESAYGPPAEDVYADAPAFYNTERPLYHAPPTRFTTYAPKLVATQEVDEYSIIGSTPYHTDATKSLELATNLVRPTTKQATKAPSTTTTTVTRGRSSQTTTASMRATGKTRTTTAMTTATTATTSTIRRTTTIAPSTTKFSSTAKSTTQIVKTTLPASVATKASRSKPHANKTHKNQRQKSPPTQPPKPPTPTQSSPTTTPSTAPTPPPQSPSPRSIPLLPTSSPLPPPTTTNALNFQAPSQPAPEPFVSVIAKSQSHSAQVQVPTESLTAAEGAGSLQSLEDVETISDESQHVQVQALEPLESRGRSDRNKFLAAVNADGYATSPRGNSVRSITEKSTFSKYTDAARYRSKNSDEYEYTGKNSEYTKVEDKPRKFVDKQKRIQSFIISDVEPQSFKPVPTIKIIAAPPAPEPEPEPLFEIIRGESSSSTTLRYPTSIVYEPKPFRYNLQTNANGFSLKAQHFGSPPAPLIVEDTTRPIYERRPSTQPLTSSTTTTTTTTSQPLRASTQRVYIEPYYEEEILPTTYAPPLRAWRIGRTSAKSLLPTEANNLRDDESLSNSSGEPSDVVAQETTTVRASTTTTTPRPTTTTSTTTSTTTDRPVQSFTARASFFKDNLIKTTGYPAARYVSPYKSLETILQEKDERSAYNGVRATTNTKPRYTSPSTPSPYAHSTSKPLRGYFLLNTPQRNLSDAIFATMSSGARNFSISDAILSNFSTVAVTATPRTTTTSTTERPTSTTAASTTPSTMSTVIATAPIRVAPAGALPKGPPSPATDFGSINAETPRPRGRSRYTAATVSDALLSALDEPTTYAPKVRYPTSTPDNSPTATPNVYVKRRKVQRARLGAPQGQRSAGATSSREKYQNYKADYQAQKSLNRKPIENESTDDKGPRAEALIAGPVDNKQDNSIESSASDSSSSTEHVVAITERPFKYLFSNKYRQQTADRTLAESLQNAGYIKSIAGRTHKFRPATVLEQLQLFLAGDSSESSSQQFVDDYAEREIKAAVAEIKNLYTATTTTTTSTTMTTTSTTTTARPPSSSTATTTTTLRPTTTAAPPTAAYSRYPTSTTSTPPNSNNVPSPTTDTPNHTKLPATTANANASSSSTTPSTPSAPTSTAKTPLTPVRASRVNNAIKSSIAAAAAYSSSTSSQASSTALGASAGRGNHKASALAANAAAAAVKCPDSTPNAKCNEIPSRTNPNSNRNRGSSSFANQDRDAPTAVTSNRGTHPPRTRPTLKPSGTIVSKAQEFIDIYRNPPTRPDPLYPQPTPDKAAAKCRKDVCLLPDCSCGGKEIPGDMPVESVPQIVLLTFDDSVNDLNKQLYTDLFEKGRVNPNGCPITATFYVSHEWTDYSQVQNLYSDGHEIASHTVSHSFGEQFSQKKWTREVAGQREILSAYGGVKLSDVRGMRAPFLSVGGNKMYKMLYDSNFTYDSSMPVYENRPPSWPYTLDYKIFHDCMIPPCPTRSYPGVWQVPMVMWQDLNGGRCSMGDACSNPGESDGVYKMIMKNFERHYTTNRAPFGLFYHAAWFTQAHHKEGFIKFLDAINAMPDVWIITNWQMLQWVRDPTPISRINSFQPFQCDYSDRPKRCNNPKVCNLWHKSGVRYMKTCQPCPDIYPWTGKTGIRSSRVDNDIEDSTA